MSYELYYRGSSSYEDAVKNALEPSFQDLTNNYQQTTAAIHELNDTNNAQLNMQAGTYNAVQAMRSDFQNSFQTGLYAIQSNEATTRALLQRYATGISNDIRQATATLFGQGLMQQQIIKHGFFQISNTLNSHFAAVENKVDSIAERLIIQSEQLEEISSHLKNPSERASQESYRWGLLSVRDECYKIAEGNFNTAISQNPRDYKSYYMLGYIYIWGASELDNIISVDKAEKALNTAWYLVRRNPDCPNELKSEISYLLGFVRRLKSDNLLIENKQKESAEKLLEAVEASKSAYDDYNNLSAGYELVKEYHFLENDDEALNLLKKLIQKDGSYAADALQDENLKSLWKKIENVIEELRQEQLTELSQKFLKTSNSWKNEIEQRQSRLGSINFPPETQIADFKQFYHSSLVKSEFLADEEFSRTVYDDFNAFVKNDLSLNSYAPKNYKDVTVCESIINTVRGGTGELKSKLDELYVRVKDTFECYDNIQTEGYFIVRKANELYLESENQNRLNSIHNSILASLGECDKTINDLENDTNNLHSYIKAQEKWSEKQVELNSNRSEEVIKECEKHCSSWKQRANELIQELLSLNLKNRTLLESIMEELDTLISRSQELLKYYNSIKNDDYFDVLKKYRKFKTSPFNSSSSYFEYTLKTLKNKIEELKNPQSKINSQFIDNPISTEKTNSVSNRHQPYNPFNLNLDALKNL